jgi:hypothetical protein
LLGSKRWFSHSVTPHPSATGPKHRQRYILINRLNSHFNFNSETTMKKLEVYDPAMCCSSGVCGTDVDQTLVTFAADVDWVRQKGAQIERFNLAQQPLAFAENQVVKGLLERSGQDALPVILLDGEIALAGRYPNRAELVRWTGIEQSEADPKPAGGCCSGSSSSCC